MVNVKHLGLVGLLAPMAVFGGEMMVLPNYAQAQSTPACFDARMRRSQDFITIEGDGVIPGSRVPRFEITRSDPYSLGEYAVKLAFMRQDEEVDTMHVTFNGDRYTVGHNGSDDEKLIGAINTGYRNCTSGDSITLRTERITDN